MKDKRLIGRYDFAKLGSLPGLGMSTTLTSLLDIGIWPIANKFLNTTVGFLIVISIPFCKHTG